MSYCMASGVQLVAEILMVVWTLYAIFNRLIAYTKRMRDHGRS